MRLKSIKLVGFKSFVDPTTANFPHNLSAIVGPNGCGKSNIIDAVRWVMGESSAKHLRGDSMADVIFNGSNTRKPVAQASIELIFDNAETTLKGELASFAEISIKREVTRDGQSNYFLNNIKCRRKDITGIFLGTGLGPRSYAIIEQGMISRLIDAKPEELRVFVEEAAGISKYKERRRETENRMRRTRENLDRLSDLRDELGRQLDRLQRQSRAAEKYKEYKGEERLLKAQLAALRWQSMDGKLKEQETNIKDLEIKLEAVVADQRHADAEIEKRRVAQTELNDSFNEIQGQYYGLGAEVARVEQSIQHQKERHQQLQTDFQQAESGWKEANEHLIEDREKVEHLSRQLEEVSPQAQQAQEKEEVSVSALATAEEAMQQWQQEWDEFNNKAAEPRQVAEVEQSRIQHLDQSIARLSDRVERLNKEKETLSAGSTVQEVEELQGQQLELEGKISSVQEQIDQITAEVQSGRSSNNELRNQIDEQKSQLQSALGRHASLDALQQAALNGDSGTADWLASQSLQGKPRVIESLQVNSGWEKAVEVVLGDYLQAVCVDNLDNVVAKLSSLNSGSLTFIDQSASTSGGAQGNTLGSVVSNAEGMGNLLGQVLIAESMEEALNKRSSLQGSQTVVTRDGIWMGSNWLRVSKETDSEAGVLERKKELEELTATIDSLETAIEETELKLQEQRQKITAHEEKRDELQKEQGQVNRELGDLSAELSARQVRLEQITMRKERLGQEVEESQQQRVSEEEQIGISRENLQNALDSMETDTADREKLLQVRDERRAVLDETRQNARHDKDTSHRLALELQSCKTQLESLQQGMARLDAQASMLQERKDQLASQLSDYDDPTGELQKELDGMLEKRLQVEEQLAEARRKLQEVEHELRELEKTRTDCEQSSQSVRSELENHRMAGQELQVRRKTVQEQLAESKFNLDEVIEGLPEDSTEEKWDEEVQRMANRINRLGPINLAAIDEYKQESERKDYLDAQDADLMSALGTLEGAIKKIDKETRTRFKETFDKINHSLQELFPKVFGGGHAYLELTGEDLLDTGVAIMARPPGKRNTTIHLLSGGEKALTALALVFSIFRLNPAPFCLLDEVDAPLDDANVGRFCNLVKEMSGAVQFIYISHNKVAMEMADVLMGVTMHEAGVSRLVSVDVEEAAELAAI